MTRTAGEAELQRLAERFARAEEAARGFVYEWDLRSGRVERSSGLTEVLGHRPDELPDSLEGWAALIHPDDADAAAAGVRSALAEGQGYSLEYRVRHKAGHYLWMWDRGSVVRSAAGEGLRVVGSSVDIGERKRVEAEQKRLLEQAQAAEREALALAQIASSLSLGDPLEYNLASIAEQVSRGVGAVACAVGLYGEDNELRSHGAYGLPEGAVAAMEKRWGNPPALRFHEMGVFRQHRQESPDIYGLLGGLDYEHLVVAPVVLPHRNRGLMLVFYPGSKALDFTDLLQLSTLTSQVALVVENARLAAESRGKAALQERQKLARELHDSVSQALYGIRLGVESARLALGVMARQSGADPAEAERSLEYAQYMADTAIAEMKSLIFELRPESLEQEGLVEALRKHTRALQLRHRLDFEVELGREPAVSLEAKEVLYRIAQEAVNNTLKHAQARAIRLRLEAAGQKVVLEVRDDGIGFDPGRSYPGHLGLVSMRERAEGLGGTLHITSASGKGTTVRAELPVGKAN